MASDYNRIFIALFDREEPGSTLTQQTRPDKPFYKGCAGIEHD